MRRVKRTQGEGKGCGKRSGGLKLLQAWRLAIGMSNSLFFLVVLREALELFWAIVSTPGLY
jgi:hypothetical protein